MATIDTASTAARSGTGRDAGLTLSPDQLILAALVLLAAVPFFIANPYWQGLWVTAACYAIVVSGLNIVTGHAGQVSLGHAGLFAIGAYSAAILSADAHLPYWVTIPSSVLITTACSLALGIPALRVSGPYLALVTISFNFLVIKIILAGGQFTGAAAGKWGVERPFVPAGAPTYGGLYALALVVLVLSVLATRNLVRSKWGRAWGTIRNDELVASVCGINVVTYKLVALLVSAALAGLGGALFAHYQGQANSESFGLSESLILLLMLLVGGQRTTLGPVVGAVIMVAIPILLSDLEQYRLFLYGIALMLLVAFFPEGLIGWLKQGQPGEAPVALEPGRQVRLVHRADNDRPLRVSGVSKRFAGVVAADQIDIEVKPGTVHSLIGPNGAGKTTIVNLITGVLPIDEGQITFAAERLDQLAPHEITQRGIARIFQNVRLLADVSVLDNVLVGGHRQLKTGFLAALLHTPRLVREEQQARVKAMGLLRLMHLDHLAMEPAGRLSYGQQHSVEIARALMSDPLVLFLDEPAAGLSAEEIAHLREIMGRVRANGITIFLIEHAVEFVMEVSDTVTVIDFGRKIAEGAPEAVRRDPKVIEAYLGASAKTLEGAV